MSPVGDFQLVSHILSNWKVFKIFNRIIVHVAKNDKACTPIFLCPNLIGFHITMKLESIHFLRLYQKVRQIFEKLLFIKKMLDFPMPHVIVGLIYFLSFSKVSNYVLSNHYHYIHCKRSTLTRI